MSILGVGLTPTSEKIGLMPILGVGLTPTSEKSRTNAYIESRTNAYIWSGTNACASNTYVHLQHIIYDSVK